MASPDFATEVLLKEGTKYAVEIIKEVFASSRTALSNLHDITSATNRYFQRYLERHGQLKLLGMTRPMDLRDVYTAVQLATPDHLHQLSSLRELEALYRERGARNAALPDAPLSDGIALANSKQFLNVLGQPGAGKSTFLRRIGFEALVPPKPVWNRNVTQLQTDLGRPYKHLCIPVFIDLKALNSGPISLEPLIREEFITCGFPESFAPAALESGKLLVLLDGLDEVASERLSEIIKVIRNFVDRYSGNRFITSCRTAFYKDWLPRFNDAVLTHFSNQQIRTFVELWFRALRSNQAADCLESLFLPGNAGILELARSPLLLTLICLVYQRTQNLASNRSYLYKRALDCLLEEWAAANLVHRPIYNGLYADLEVQMLSRIAADAFEQERFFFAERELVTRISSFLQGELNAPKHLDGREVLNAIEIQQGLIVQRAHDVFSFSHVSLQEYFTARYVFDSGGTRRLVEAHLQNERWREIFLLLAGFARADELISCMVDGIDRHISANGLAKVVSWLNRTVDHDGTADAVLARRAIALNLLFFLSKQDIDTGPLRSMALRLSRGDSIFDSCLDSVATLSAIFSQKRNSAPSVHSSAMTELINRFRKVFTQPIVEALEEKVAASMNTGGEPSRGMYPIAENTKGPHATICEALQIDGPLQQLISQRKRPLGELSYVLLLVVETRDAALSLSSATWHLASQRLLLSASP